MMLTIFKKSNYLLFLLICLFIVFSLKTVSATTNLNVLFYTGQVAITGPDGNTITYVLPQELTTISTDSIAECLDGTVVIQAGDTKLILETSDKVQFVSNKDDNTMEIICLRGDIQVISGDYKLRIKKDQRLAFTSSGNLDIGAVKKFDSIDTADVKNINSTVYTRSKIEKQTFLGDFSQADFINYLQQNQANWEEIFPVYEEQTSTDPLFSSIEDVYEAFGVDPAEGFDALQDAASTQSISPWT